MKIATDREPKIQIENRLLAALPREDYKQVLLRYTHALVNQIFQSAVCNLFHTVEERLCRWLLIAHDTLKSDSLQITQKFLSQMLGARRAGITVAVGILQNAGIISHNRGE